MAMGTTAFRLVFLILRGIAASALGSAAHIARRASLVASGTGCVADPTSNADGRH
jgi:hypothetical protein